MMFMKEWEDWEEEKDRRQYIISCYDMGQKLKIVGLYNWFIWVA